MLAHRIVVSLTFLTLFMSAAPANGSEDLAARFMTFNLEDVRSSDLEDGTNPRLKKLAAVIQNIRPNVLVLNEIARDPQGRNAQRFADLYLSVSQAPGLDPLTMTGYMPMTNTGYHSGHDYNNDGTVLASHPPIRESDLDGNPPRQTTDERTYGNDCFGFGVFPGQYAMGILIDRRLEIQSERTRTYQHFLWRDLQNPSIPRTPGGDLWYSEIEWASFRLSSKNHAIIPVLFPNGTSVDVVVAHPTPPAFDGPEARNKRRNLDELRLLSLILSNSDSITDDQGAQGGVDPDTPAVVMGDLNADPADRDARSSQIAHLLINHERMGPDPDPESVVPISGLDATDTARFRKRVDYVLPTQELRVIRTGIWRGAEALNGAFPSDHFPVWVDLIVPAP